MVGSLTGSVSSGQLALGSFPAPCEIIHKWVTHAAALAQILPDLGARIQRAASKIIRLKKSN